MSISRKSQTRDKIIQAAFELFYQQGYQATTVDQIIDKSGVSKPTVYSHFPSKEDLCVAYMKERHSRELQSLDKFLKQEKTAKDRYLGVMRWMQRGLIDSNYRGCGFFNMVSEIPDPKNPIVYEAKNFVDQFRKVIKERVNELRESDDKYKGLDPDRIADAYYLIVGGSIMGSQEYRDSWPTDRALLEVEKLIE